jgi:hypothetical protein
VLKQSNLSFCYAYILLTIYFITIVSYMLSVCDVFYTVFNYLLNDVKVIYLAEDDLS